MSIAGAASASADDFDPPLAAVEARVGHGVAVGGGSGQFNVRSSALTFSALGEVAIRDTPWTSILLGGMFEGGDRSTAGVIGGVRVRPESLPVRASLGLIAILTPVTALGPVATAGYCSVRGLRFCLDVEASAFVVGDDLPERKIAAQLQLVLGVGFDLD